MKNYQQVKDQQKQQKRPETFEDRIWWIVCNNGDVISNDSKCSISEEIYDRLYKYSDEGFLEEQSATIEDNLLMQFFKLASISNYKNLNARADEVAANEGIQELGSLPLSQSPFLRTIKKIVEDFQGNWHLFFKADENELYRRCVESSDDNRLSRSLKKRITGTKVPNFSQVFNSVNLSDFTVDCYYRSLEMAACAHLAYRIDATELSWFALSKSKEFLGIYKGARTTLDKEIKKTRQYFNENHSIDAMIVAINLKFLELSKLKFAGIEVDKTNKFREYRTESELKQLFDDLLFEDHIYPLIYQIRGFFILKESEDTKETYRKLFFSWVEQNETLKHNYDFIYEKSVGTDSDVRAAVHKLKQLHDHLKDKKINEDDELRITKKQWQSFLYELEDQLLITTMYRHDSCSLKDECPIKKLEDERYQAALKFLRNPLSL
ncbi:hypothetical protein [Thiomicrorhabdus indica]|uniref:hypothetical protein n=1 Tax=Thiomicrorhabdus indica TaxID=2267253 RepID=UPI002AA811D6|nr:hypothetical protein [Thiomicrorhabdus indica]